MIGDVPGGERKHDHRDDLHQADQAERQFVAGAQPEFPANAKRNHLAAEGGQKLPDDQQAKIAEAQRSIGVAPCLEFSIGCRFQPDLTGMLLE